jgi:hypothetical protein
MQPACLSDLAYDDRGLAVIDDLAALQLANPALQDYAEFARNPPSLIPIADRAFHYAQQNRRFFELAGVTPVSVVGENVASVYANVLLHNAAVIALALLPAHCGSDRHAMRQVGQSFRHSRIDADDADMHKFTRVAFELDAIDAAELAADAIAFAAARTLSAQDCDAAAIHPLEHRTVLHAFATTPSDLDALAQQIERHARAADAYAATLETDELSPGAHQRLEVARAGAMLQHWIALARLALATGPEDTCLNPILNGAIARAPIAAACALRIAREIGAHSRDMINQRPPQ